VKLGLVTAILPELSLAEVAQFAADTGYDCLEVMCWPPSQADRRYAGVTHIDVTDFNEEAAAHVRQTTADAGVSISALGYYPNPLAPNDEAKRSVAHLKKVIAAAPLLELDIVNTFVGRDWTKSIDDNWPRFLETWRPLVEFAADHGVRLGIENCPMLFTADEWPGGKNLAVSPAIWRRMFADIPDENFGLNYDPSHFVWQQIGWLAPLEEFASRIFHVHAKDVALDHAALNNVGILAHPLEYHAPKLPGRGDIDWAVFCAKLQAIGYNGPVCVEVEDREFEDTLEARKESLRLSQAHLAPFFT
jgi:sugar phosphate isomerase/epimerase